MQLAVSRLLAESKNMPEACNGVLRVLCESLKFDRGEIWQIDSSANRLLHAQSWCVPSREHLQFQDLSQGAQFRCGEGLVAIEMLKTAEPFAVITSDQRMPRMTGTQFLTHARVVVPTSVRALLTGQADMQSAIDAINEGNIFRSLTKP